MAAGRLMLKRLTRTAMSRGFVGGSRAWVVVGTAAIALRVTARVTGKRPRVVYRQTLQPGESVLVTAGEATTL